MFAAYAESGRCVGKGRDKAQARGRRGGAERERAMGSKTEERKRADCSLSTPTLPPRLLPLASHIPAFVFNALKKLTSLTVIGGRMRCAMPP